MRLYPQAPQRLYPLHVNRLFPAEYGESVPPTPPPTPTENIGYATPSGGTIEITGIDFSNYAAVEIFLQDIHSDTDSVYAVLEVMIGGAWVVTGYEWGLISVNGGGTTTSTENHSAGESTAALLTDLTAGWKIGNVGAECLNGFIEVHNFPESGHKYFYAETVYSGEGNNFIGTKAVIALENTGVVTGVRITTPGANIDRGSMLITGIVL